MDSKKIENILKMSNENKYSYSLRKVADFEEVWGLYNEGWAMLGNRSNEVVFPFWPEKEFAKFVAEDTWEEYIPKSVNIYDFIEKWLPSMSKDNINIFYDSINKGLIVSPLKLKEDLELEMEQYE